MINILFGVVHALLILVILYGAWDSIRIAWFLASNPDLSDEWEILMMERNAFLKEIREKMKDV